MNLYATWLQGLSLVWLRLIPNKEVAFSMAHERLKHCHFTNKRQWPVFRTFAMHE